ncbi:MAG: response regulator [Anaerolineales bacterium]|nr:response regulator [Anaerolineales bacterium]
MTEQETIRVLIVDDHAVVRGGLKYFLSTIDDIEVVAEAEDGEKALEVCSHVEPDIVLMDMVMPRMDGVLATQVIASRFPEIRVIALTSFQEEDLVHKALKAGAISYLLKDVPPSDLAEAIRAAHAGRPTLAPEATQALIHSVSQSPRLGYDLTEREREVLNLVAEGLNNEEIAQTLGISRNTVRYHVSNILSKLGASNRTEAAGLAVQYNLVQRT